jgi:hypothetical protein
MSFCPEDSGAGDFVEAGKVAILTAEVKAQMALIEAVYVKLETRAADLAPENEAGLESIAYQIHNLYNAVEDLLKLLASRFENQITDTSQGHSALLRRMTQAVEGMRPAVLSEESYSFLNGLRGFRHFFRHAYGVTIDYGQLSANLVRARGVRATLQRDMQRFLEAL